MDIERRIFECETRADSDSGRIVGHAAVFNSLSENLGGFREQIAPGAFDGVLGDDVRALINHDSNLVLGRTTAGTLSLSVDARGLVYDVDMPDTSYARDLMVSMGRGDVNQSSFGFIVDRDSWTEDEEGRIIRTIQSFRQLIDVSPVTIPAYPDATVGLRHMQEYVESKTPKYHDLEPFKARIALVDRRL